MRPSAVSLTMGAVLVMRSLADASQRWSHEWDNGASMLWADFSSSHMLDATQLPFIASAYGIVSLEKCFGQGDGLLTEDAFVAQAVALKSVNPAIRVIFYWHAMVDIVGPAFTPCYAAGKTFLESPQLWLYGDDGVPLMNGPFLQHNLTLAATERYMVDIPLGVLQRAPTVFDGVFADGTLASPYANMSSDRNAALNTAVNAVVLAQSLALNAAKPNGSVQVIGNGLAQYHDANAGFPADDGMGMVPFLDGVCVEHWAAFEMTDASNCSLVPSKMVDMMERIAVVASLNKTVLVKGWPGPISLPITSFGPSWPASCGTGPGESHAARGQSALRYFTPSYALFLLVADDTVWWSYSWWYDVNDGYYPPASVAEANVTSAPYGWYPDLQKPVGRPTGPAIRTTGGSGYVFTRSFASGTRVTVDLANWTAAVISYASDNDEA